MYRITVYLDYPDGVFHIDYKDTDMVSMNKVLDGLVFCDNMRFIEVAKLNMATGLFLIIEEIKVKDGSRIYMERQ